MTDFDHILPSFHPITLEEMDAVALQDRMDTKYICWGIQDCPVNDYLCWHEDTRTSTRI
jgi:hypothetical protein